MMRRGACSLFFLAALCGLGGCGFHSVYATRSNDGSPVNERMATVAIDPIPDHNGQMLRNDLIDRFYGKGRPAQPAYHLSVKVHTSEEDLGLLANATTTLAAVHVYGDYVLKDAAGKTLISGTVQGTASYDKLASDYATLASHDSAVERTVLEVSEQLTNRISLYFAEPPPVPAQP